MTNASQSIGWIMVLSLGLLAWPGCERSHSSPSRGDNSNDADAARVVQGFQVIEQPLDQVVTASGSLAPQDFAVLSTKVSGRLEKLAVDLGDRVKKGDVLAQIEARDYEIKVRQAEALLAQARVKLGLNRDGASDEIEAEQTSPVKQARALLDEARANRTRILNLSQQGIISQSELEAVESAFQVASSRYEDALEEVRSRQALVAQRRAELEMARQQLSETSIHAPFDGAIQERKANLGEMLQASSPVLSLVRMDPLRLRLEIREADAGRIQIGQKVRLTIDGSSHQYAGEIKRLSPMIDEAARILQVEADVPNPGNLRPGSFARAEIVVSGNQLGVTIPPSAVVRFAGIERVFLVKEGKAVERPIATGRAVGDSVEVLSGLEGGQVIVLEPGGLRTGDRVQLSN